MVYNETVISGNIVLNGTGNSSVLHEAMTRFWVRDTLYSYKKARKGVLEKVVIKDIKYTNSSYGPLVLYKDTLNGLWNEGELVSYERALSIIQNYFYDIATEN